MNKKVSPTYFHFLQAGRLFVLIKIAKKNQQKQAKNTPQSYPYI
jgi:hypothetical protein